METAPRIVRVWAIALCIVSLLLAQLFPTRAWAYFVDDDDARNAFHSSGRPPYAESIEASYPTEDPVTENVLDKEKFVVQLVMSDGNRVPVVPADFDISPSVIPDDTHGDYPVEVTCKVDDETFTATVGVPADTGIASYAAVYGGNTFVVGRNATVPPTYAGKSLTTSWRNIENVAAWHVEGSSIVNDCPWKGYTSKITNAHVIDPLYPVSIACWFKEMGICTTIDGLQLLDVSRCQDFTDTFASCRKATTISGLDSWDTSSATDFHGMFYECNAIANLAVTKWDTSNVTSFMHMFYGCNAIKSLDLSQWRTPKLKATSWMFEWCNSMTTINVSGWDTRNITSFQSMFPNCEKLVTVNATGWDTSNARVFGAMFASCYALKTVTGIENWNTSSATDMSYMFQNAKVLNVNLTKWNVKKVTSYFNFNYLAPYVKAPAFGARAAAAQIDLSPVADDETILPDETFDRSDGADTPSATDRTDEKENGTEDGEKQTGTTNAEEDEPGSFQEALNDGPAIGIR